MTTIRCAVLSLVFLTDCGGSQVNAGPAYATAVHVARQFCAVVAALPEPTPTSGGEATP